MAKRRVLFYIGDRAMAVSSLKAAQCCYDAVWLLVDVLKLDYDRVPNFSIKIETVYGDD